MLCIGECLILHAQLGERCLCLDGPAGGGVDGIEDLRRGLDQLARNVALLPGLDQHIRQFPVQLLDLPAESSVGALPALPLHHVAVVLLDLVDGIVLHRLFGEADLSDLLRGLALDLLDAGVLLLAQGVEPVALRDVGQIGDLVGVLALLVVLRPALRR